MAAYCGCGVGELRSVVERDAVEVDFVEPDSVEVVSCSPAAFALRVVVPCVRLCELRSLASRLCSSVSRQRVFLRSSAAVWSSCEVLWLLGSASNPEEALSMRLQTPLGSRSVVSLSLPTTPRFQPRWRAGEAAESRLSLRLVPVLSAETLLGIDRGRWLETRRPRRILTQGQTKSCPFVMQ